MELKSRKKLRIFIPRFPNFNIYSILAKTTTSVGPLYVATSAASLDCWDTEVIDENNLHGKHYPRLSKNILDHKKLQEDDPADVVGFYGSITSSVPRLFEMAKFYKSLGVTTIAGGKHVENLPDEALNNGIDYILLGEGEITIRKFLNYFEQPDKRDLVKGICYLKDSKIVKTETRTQIENLDMLPIPDYHRLRYGKIKLYPIVGTRGCNSNCEFCAVKDKARTCSSKYLLKNVKQLVEKYNAKSFFEVSDHFASNMNQAIEFLNGFADYQKKIKRKLHLTIQTRITDARNKDYLKAIKRANVDTICIGFESPIDKDLLVMKKGYISKDMLEWTKLFKQQRTRIHGMFIFAYPDKDDSTRITNLNEYTNQYWDFIRKSRIDTIQILQAIPLPGTELRERLQKRDQLYSTNDIGWKYYDGQYPLYNPSGEITSEQLLKTAGDLMKKFYKRTFFIHLVKNIILDFPIIVFPSLLSLIGGKPKKIRQAFDAWNKKYYQKSILRLGGNIIIRNWFKNFRSGDFLHKLNIAKKNI